MKNYLILALVLTLGFPGFAQKKELRSAKKALLKENYENAGVALDAAEAFLETMDDKYKSKYYLYRSMYYSKSGGGAKVNTVKGEFNGVKNDVAIDKLISLNDYTITRTPGTNLFESIADLESDPPIDINSRTELDDIAQILDNNIDITSIILDPVNSASVPYLHRFFKFDYLNTDKELFLLVSSALTGSTAITADIDGLYVEINKTNPNPFITSTDVSSYDLTSQLISFDLTNGLVGGDQFKYDNDYLNPSLYGKGATSYLIDVKYNDQHSLEYFGFTGASTVSILVKGLLPNRLYNKNFLTYNVGLVGSKSKMFNFEFQTGVTGIEFSCKSELTQLPGKILSYNLRLKDLKYVSYPDSTVYQLDTAIPYDLCIDFNDSTSYSNNNF